MLNPLGSKGNMAKAFAAILHELWHGELPYLVPFSFRVRIVFTFFLDTLLNTSPRNRSVSMLLNSAGRINMIHKNFSLFYWMDYTRILIVFFRRRLLNLLVNGKQNWNRCRPRSQANRNGKYIRCATIVSLLTISRDSFVIGYSA